MDRTSYPQELAHLVIYSSQNGRDGWMPVHPSNVPDWVTAPEVMGRLARGEECMDCADGESGSAWYRAVLVEDLKASVPQ